MNVEQAGQIEGWMSGEELRWLAAQAESRGVIVEVGSWYGRSTRALADNLPEGGKLYAVDSWLGVGDDLFYGQAKEQEGDGAFMRFYTNLADHINVGRVMPVRMCSVNAAEVLQGVQPDMIFIDGDHSKESARADILAWGPLLASGGLLCGHDYTSSWPGIVEAVDELLTVRQPPGTDIWEAI